MVTQNHLLRRYIIPLLPSLAVILLLVALQTVGLEESLRYDRRGILSGEVWRIVTGHWVHLGWSHLWLNAAGLVLIYLLFGPLLRLPAWGLHTLIACCVVSAGLLMWNPGLIWYVGLSGVLHGLFAVGLLTEMERDRRFALLILAVFAAKLMWEQYYGPLPGSESSAGGPVVVDAHWYGAISGVLSYALIWSWRSVRHYVAGAG